MTRDPSASTAHRHSERERPDQVTWTPELIRSLGSTTDVPTLAAIMRCSTWKAYQMARTGQWEASGIHIIRIGSGYKVSVASILEALGGSRAPNPAS